MGKEPRIVGGANLLEIFAPTHQTNKPGPKRLPGRREKICGFSDKARYNLAKSLSRIDWILEPVHICLTYGESWPDKPKADLNVLNEWFRYRGIGGVWRLEFQSRNLWHAKGKRAFCNGERKTFETPEKARSFCDSQNEGRTPTLVPHNHLLVHGFFEEQEAKLRGWWGKRSGNRSEYAISFTYRDEGKAAWYMAMHAAKTNQSPNIAVGRWWGWINKPAVEKRIKRTEFGTLSRAQETRLYRIVRRLTNGKYRPRAGRTFSIFYRERTQHKILLFLALMEEDG